MIRLLAMSPSGEALVVRNLSGKINVYRPADFGGMLALDEGAVEEAIAANDLLRIDREFANWQELDDFRQEEVRRLVPPLELDIEGLTADDVRPLVDIAEQWGIDNDPRAGELARRLLEDVPAAQQDDLLRQRLREVLAQRGRLVIPGENRPRSEIQQRAIERWRDVRQVG